MKEGASVHFTGRLQKIITIKTPDGMSKPITLSIPVDEADQDKVIKQDGTIVPTKYNPVSGTIECRTMDPGGYTTDTNEVDFTDISGTTEDMKEAIMELASSGVLAGTSKNKFSPDKEISRAEIATLIVKVLGLYSEHATTTYTDVTKNNWYYHGAASSQQANLLSGYGDGMFHGEDLIKKDQIITVCGNVLIENMGYKTKNLDPEKILARYKDSVASWGKVQIALATQMNLVPQNTDKMFHGDITMTRGEAAVIINRLFERIW